MKRMSWGKKHLFQKNTVKHQKTPAEANNDGGKKDTVYQQVPSPGELSKPQIVSEVQSFQMDDAVVTVNFGIFKMEKVFNLPHEQLYMENHLPFMIYSVRKNLPPNES